jgi:hypothetical protein
MGSADLPEAAATRQQNSYTISQRCAVFVFRHANLRTKGIREAAHGVDVLPNRPGNSMTDDKYGTKLTDYEYGVK